MAETYMLLNDVVKRIMKATGRTRRQAEQAVLQALKSGEVKARGEVVVTDPHSGEEDNQGVQSIPVEVWRSIPSEH
jgi:hypothetical protein